MENVLQFVFWNDLLTLDQKGKIAGCSKWTSMVMKQDDMYCAKLATNFVAAHVPAAAPVMSIVMVHLLAAAGHP